MVETGGRCGPYYICSTVVNTINQSIKMLHVLLLISFCYRMSDNLFSSLLSAGVSRVRRRDREREGGRKGSAKEGFEFKTTCTCTLLNSSL